MTLNGWEANSQHSTKLRDQLIQQTCIARYKQAHFAEAQGCIRMLAL